MSVVGIVANPHAGKDIRRLVSASSHTSDAAKTAIIRRCAIGAVEAGATKVLLSADRNHLGERAIEGLDGSFDLLETPGTGSRLDTIDAVRQLRQAEADSVIVLGGDGTMRDTAIAWPGLPLIAISTGTNNVFPLTIDGTSAGVAAALVATGIVAIDAVSASAKRLTINERNGSYPARQPDVALVEVALIDAAFVGSRAVWDPSIIRSVVACIAEPASTGLSAIAGRISPIGRNEPGAIAIELEPAGRPLRVPLSPGAFTTIGIGAVHPMMCRDHWVISGPGALAIDGERDRVLTADDELDIGVDRDGPRVIDVAATLRIAAKHHTFFPVPFSAPKGS